MDDLNEKRSPPVQARVPWSTLWLDISLIVAAALIVLLSIIIDCRARRAEWFDRSGAIVVLIAGLLGYRSLTRHYRKFYNDMVRGYPLSTSNEQRAIDYIAVVLSVVGTLVWGYGDKVILWLCMGLKE